MNFAPFKHLLESRKARAKGLTHIPSPDPRVIERYVNTGNRQSQEASGATGQDLGDFKKMVSSRITSHLFKRN
jgi:hypothetical protein